MKIFLVGNIAAGKSTFGRELAANLNFKFIDLDDYIEEKFKISIEDIFEKFEEDIFHDIEKQCLLNISKLNEHLVVSCGGSVVINKESVEILKNNGFIFEIFLNKNICIENIIDEPKNRPKGDEVYKKINILEREYFLLKFHIIDNTKSLEEKIKEIKFKILNDIRIKVKEFDKEIFNTINERLKLTKELSLIKDKIEDKNVENSKFVELCSYSNFKNFIFKNEEMKNILENIFEISKRLQNETISKFNESSN